MVFSSIPFLFFFLPIVFTIYFLTPGKYKNIIILASSLFFYAWGEPRNVIIMVLTIILSYIFGILIEKNRENQNTQKAKALCGISVALELSFLIYFKYTDFLIENFNNLTGLSVPLLKIALPVGISFYTFQLISYTVDVYRGEKAQRNFIDMAAYIAMFPQLVAGPIVRYTDIRESLNHRTHTIENISLGVRRFVIGLGKKVLLANQLGEFCDIFKASDDKSVLFYWIYALAFSLFIYFDFSGYSDMAIGLGKIMGFNFLENFNYPFSAANISEFWRRWHMSLGSWFRDYIYIPLGGNRVKAGRRFFNIFVVWLLTGLWHGAAWNFCIWGLYFAVLLVIEKNFLGKFLDKHRITSHIYTIFFLAISFVIFNADGFKGMMADLGGLFGQGVPLVSKSAIYYSKSYMTILLMGVVGSLPFFKHFCQDISEKVRNILEPIFILGILVIVTAFLVDGSFNPFLYFRF